MDRALILAAGMKAISIIATFAVTAVLVRILSVEEFSSYQLFMTAATTTALSSRSAISGYMLRLGAANRVITASVINDLLWNKILTYAVIGVVLYVSMTGDLLVGLVVGVYICVDLMMAALTAHSRGLGGSIWYSCPDLVLRYVIYLGVIILWYFFGSVSEYLAYAIYIVTLFALAFCLTLANQRLKQGVPKERTLTKPRVSFSSVLFLTACVAVVNNIDMILLGIIEHGSNIGQYKLHTQIASLTVFGVAASSLAYVPKIIRSIRENNLKEARSYYRSSVTISAGTALIVSAILLSNANKLFEVAFGSSFQLDYMLLTTLLAPRVVTTFVGPAFAILVSSMVPVKTVLFMALAIVASIAVCLIAKPIISIYAYSLAISVGMMTTTLISAVTIKQYLYGENS